MAKRKVIWSNRAKIDLFNILEFFLIRNKSKVYSRKLSVKVRKSINLLIKYPYLGIPTDIENVRCLFESNYAIFYQVDNEIVWILTIWDCRQNPENKNGAT